MHFGVIKCSASLLQKQQLLCEAELGPVTTLLHDHQLRLYGHVVHHPILPTRLIICKTAMSGGDQRAAHVTHVRGKPASLPGRHWDGCGSSVGAFLGKPSVLEVANE